MTAYSSIFGSGGKKKKRHSVDSSDDDSPKKKRSYKDVSFDSKVDAAKVIDAMEDH